MSAGAPVPAPHPPTRQGLLMPLLDVFCPNGHPVPADATNARFCRSCGEPLLRHCPDGHTSVASGKFCTTCGTTMETGSVEATAAVPAVSAVAAIVPESPTVDLGEDAATVQMDAPAVVPETPAVVPDTPAVVPDDSGVYRHDSSGCSGVRFGGVQPTTTGNRTTIRTRRSPHSHPFPRRRRRPAVRAADGSWRSSLPPSSCSAWRVASSMR